MFMVKVVRYEVHPMKPCTTAMILSAMKAPEKEGKDDRYALLEPLFLFFFVFAVGLESICFCTARFTSSSLKKSLPTRLLNEIAHTSSHKLACECVIHDPRYRQ